ncbi:MAG: HD-GYP domain-containing protein, partial [Vicinamibacterales bacterium]
PVVLVTGTDIDARLLGIEAGADDFLRKPIRPAELIARVRALIRVKRYVDELDSADSMIVSLARAVEARDPSTAGHCDRMAQYAAVFGTELTLRPEEVLALHRGGILHDLGKIAVPDAILLKDGPLTPAERDVMRRHTIIGDSLCKDLKVLRPVRPIIRQHHERVDGSGYPDGVCGNRVSLLAQIVGIVDVYDAVTTARPYRVAQGPEAACHVLTYEADRGWRRRDLVSEFIRLAQLGVFHHRPERPAGVGA